ncbi:MAG TPA: hypothetical protein VMX13_08370 [Sedimentisphaerales bacterium]|nr:hypothetical protein [Sedimentisphaerales bacterium]
MNGQIEQYDYLPAAAELKWQPFDEYGFTSPWAPRLWQAAIGVNYVTSGLLTLAIGIGFAVVSDECRHWCLIPLLLCGAVAGPDLIAWFRKELDGLDPKALVAAHIYLTCFVAPLLHLSFEAYGEDFYVSGWADYFGYMACFNFAGIILYKLVHNILFKRTRPVNSFWKMQPGKFIYAFVPVLAISLGASAAITLFFGGLIKRAGVLSLSAGAEEYSGYLSVLLMLGDPTVSLIVMTVIYWLYQKNHDKPRSLGLVMILIMFAFILQFLLVGRRGSRSDIVVAVAALGGIIHYRLRPFSPKLILLGMFAVVMFVYLYGFYKFLGPRGWEAFYSTQARTQMKYELGGNSPLATVLNRAKSDVQAFLLFRLAEYKGQYEPVHGRTYAMAVLTFIPRAIWKTKPVSIKTEAGTAIQGYSSIRVSRRVYGLAGEAMLNFGYWGIVPAFLVFGMFLGWFRKKVATMEPSDSRFFLIPFVVLTCGLVLGSDSRNLVFGLLKMGVLPFLVVFIGSARAKFARSYE